MCHTKNFNSSDSDFYKNATNKKEIEDLLDTWEINDMDFYELESKLDMILEENPEIESLDTVLYRMLAIALQKE